MNNTTTGQRASLWTVRMNDRRPYDYDSGKRLAATQAQMVTCECCGKRCAVTHVMSNGLEVGRECAVLLEQVPMWGVYGLKARQLAHLERALTGQPKEAT